MEFDTFVICHVFMHCFGSFQLQAMFLSLQVFASRDKIWNQPRICCLLAFYDAGHGCLFVSYHEYHICPHTFFFGDVVAFLWDSYTFVQRHFNVSCSYLIELMFRSRARCIGLFPLWSFWHHMIQIGDCFACCIYSVFQGREKRLS